MTMKSIRILSTALLTLGAVAAHALTFTFDSPTLSASSGGTATFTGTLLNDEAADLFVAADSITLDLLDPQDWAGLTVDDTFLTDFLAQYPGLFPVGATYSGPLFSVSVGPTATTRLNTGNFALIDAAGAPLADQNFALDVTQAVPEPTSGALLIGGLALLRRRRR